VKTLIFDFQDWRNRPLYHPSGALLRKGYACTLAGIQGKLSVVGRISNSVGRIDTDIAMKKRKKGSFW
jgi:hypothetical protein